ncbi:hypothetical protein Nepgr_028788 [Nepenthes gracilis]|uniref:Uncharacterized protein n=1 Tax=Nepenthes gracilis TaxID=150966 RepID=A0AAD3TB19_NEPGR|nr:hypothetical protein Nepgr_028788 [Nepenthes gracilis]
MPLLASSCSSYVAMGLAPSLRSSEMQSKKISTSSSQHYEGLKGIRCSRNSCGLGVPPELLSLGFAPFAGDIMLLNFISQACGHVVLLLNTTLPSGFPLHP